jgi:hypothetical protein
MTVLNAIESISVGTVLQQVANTTLELFVKVNKRQIFLLVLLNN